MRLSRIYIASLAFRKSAVSQEQLSAVHQNVDLGVLAENRVCDFDLFRILEQHCATIFSMLYLIPGKLNSIAYEN